MKRQLLSILGLCVFSVALLSVSASHCFAQDALPETDDENLAAATSLWITLSDGSRIRGELDPMETFRLTSGEEERVFYPNDLAIITLNHATGEATVQFANGDTLTGELEFGDYLAVETAWGAQVDIEGDFITSIRNADASNLHGGTVIIGGGTVIIDRGGVIELRIEEVRDAIEIMSDLTPPELPEENAANESEEE